MIQELFGQTLRALPTAAACSGYHRWVGWCSFPWSIVSQCSRAC